MKKRAFYLLAALAGCVATQPERLAWREGVSVAQIKKDSLECKVIAANAVPVNNQVGVTPTYTTPIYAQPSYTSCYGGRYSVNCTTTGGGYTGGQTYGGQAYTYDANRELRQEYQTQCMAQRGYGQITVRQCSASEIKSATRIFGPDGKLPAASEILCANPENGTFVLTD